MGVVEDQINTITTQSSIEGKQMKQSWKQKQMLLIHLETGYNFWPTCKNKIKFLSQKEFRGT